MYATTYIVKSRVWVMVTWRRRWRHQSTRRMHFPNGPYWTPNFKSFSFRDI